MNFLSHFPDPDELLKNNADEQVLHVNGHIHTPYSFSSFDEISRIFERARDEQVDVLGINDFFVADGYGEFAQLAEEYKKFPLFNVEFIGLITEYQQRGITVNDPNNPGRIYFSGKGLDFPLKGTDDDDAFLNALMDESRQHVSAMIEKVDGLLKQVNPKLGLTYSFVKEKYARELVRERHIAKAIRVLAESCFTDENERLDFYSALLGTVPKSDLADFAALENEIRGKLLKSGGPAFVPEAPASFPPVEQIRDYILHRGGIPCYPVLLDDRKGKIITGFESDWERMDQKLKELQVYMLELIPSRNSLAKLREFVAFFSERGYAISLGSEHNTPGEFPVEVKVDGANPLPDNLKEVSYQGACVIAAHQYLHAKGKMGFVNLNGQRSIYSVEELARFGNAIIKYFIAK